MKTLVFIPTYNERLNVERIASEIAALGLDLDLLFIDDASPDQTGEALDRLAATRSRLKVLHREGKAGIGSAHQAGLRWAYAQGYDTLVTMDCDGTHPPRYLPDFLRLRDAADVVVGSRHLSGDALKDWDPARKLLTRLAFWGTRALLGMPHDATGAFRLYRLDRVPRRLFDLVQSPGYSFFFESLLVLHQNGLKIVDVPITLPARTRGHSKMRLADGLHSAGQLLYLALTRLVDRERLLLGEPFVPPEGPRPADAAWDAYWLKRPDAGGMAYGILAALYRKLVIRRALKGFVDEYFAPGAELLHAGCGGGQADADVTATHRVTALDLSVPALEMYAKSNPSHGRLLLGDIRRLPLPDASVDGVYNLGVMEHLSPDDVQAALREFVRVLRPRGRILLFWPPVFGPTVLLLDAVHFLLNRLLGLGVKLHPDEINRVVSEPQMRRIVEEAGLALERFYWGPRDLFTHAVLVISKPGAVSAA